MTESYTPEQTTNTLALVRKLIGLGIQAKPIGVEQGPVVTAYFFELDQGESLSKFLKRSEDFALSLGVDKVITQRIKDKVVIFIPNKERKIVDFKDVLYWYMNDEKVKEMEIPVPLGVDFHGNKSAFDLAACPHVLLTGSTGSGKSVYEAAILSSLGYYFNPSELNMYLVDTKKLDLPLFKTLPHVLDVADDLDKFHNMINTIMLEIRRRNSMLQNAQVRNIQSYHKMMGGKESLPYIILMLDEFGYLIKLDEEARKEDKEKYEDIPRVMSRIQTAAGIARAAGVHIIACTQRADVKVINGTIKTNLPCRIALRCTSRVDSQTILDTGGAENLLGKGDMLVKYPENDILVRYHGPYVDMADIQQLTMNYDMIKGSMRS
jgi:S-DNA-T family DNA segregation ATPase FtsK/SpoIIIE